MNASKSFSAGWPAAAAAPAVPCCCRPAGRSSPCRLRFLPLRCSSPSSSLLLLLLLLADEELLLVDPSLPLLLLLLLLLLLRLRRRFLPRLASLLLPLPFHRRSSLARRRRTSLRRRSRCARCASRCLR